MRGREGEDVVRNWRLYKYVDMLEVVLLWGRV